MDWNVLEAEGAGVVDVLNVGDSCPGLRPSPEWMLGPMPKTGSLREVMSGTDSPTLAVCSSVWLDQHVWARLVLLQMEPWALWARRGL